MNLTITIYPVLSSRGMQTGTIPAGVFLFDSDSQIGVCCVSERSQHGNKEKAMAMLEILIELEGV